MVINGLKDIVHTAEVMHDYEMVRKDNNSALQNILYVLTVTYFPSPVIA